MSKPKVGKQNHHISQPVGEDARARGGGAAVIMSCMAAVVYPSYNAGTEHVGFSPTR